MLRVGIVDDEAPARAALRILLAERPELEVVAECTNGSDAVDMIRRTPLELLLLDVQMPGLNGLEVAGKIGPAEMPPTVFVTAYDKYAVHAFEVQAIDYILKPFDGVRFHAAMDRAISRIGDKRTADWAHRLGDLLGRDPGTPIRSATTRLPISVGDRVAFVDVSEIDWISASGQHVVLHVGSREYTLRKTLQSVLANLPSSDFAQIHRSCVVNLARVKELVRLGKGDAQVVLATGDQLRLSRRYREQLRVQLGWPI
jgi:two-component system LytT family response regulator